MAVFRDEDHSRLDYLMLRDGPVRMYFARRILEEDLGWLRAHGYVVDRFDALTWASEEDALGAIARALEFPNYFGGNLDALNDCLGAVDIPTDSGRAVVIERFDGVYAQSPDWWWNLLDVFAVQSRRHLLFGERLLVLLQSDDPRLSIPPVGKSGVGWNRREWSYPSRGL